MHALGCFSSIPNLPALAGSGSVQSDNDAFDKENRKSTDDPDHKIIGVVLGVIENEKFVPVK